MKRSRSANLDLDENKPRRHSKASVARFAYYCYYCLIVTLFSLYFIIITIRKISSTNWVVGLLFILFAAVFFLSSILPLVIDLFGRKSTNSETARKSPWLAREDWASGQIKCSAPGDMRIYFIVGAGVVAAGTIKGILVILDIFQGGNYSSLLWLTLPLFGVCVIKYSLICSQNSKSIFRMKSIPAFPGGEIEGIIETKNIISPKHDILLDLVCVYRKVCGGGSETWISEDVLWRKRKVFESKGLVPELQPQKQSIPVYFEIPFDKPGCLSETKEAICWRLEVKAANLSGRFSALLFDLPVFEMDTRKVKT